MAFPSNFDFSFYLQGIYAALDLTDHSMAIVRVFWHIYQTLHYFPSDLRKTLVETCFLKTPHLFTRFFFHWSFNVREILNHLIIY